MEENSEEDIDCVTEEIIEEEYEEEVGASPDEGLSADVLVAAMREADEKEIDPNEEFKSALKALFSPAREAEKPDIESLDDAIIDVPDIGLVFLPQIGDGVIIEYPAVWRDTSFYTVQYVDYDTGAVRLWDPANRRQACTNYLDAIKCGLKLKLPAEGASPRSVSEQLTHAGSKKRFTRTVKRIVARQTVASDPTKPRNSSRGRPKGVKNRSKEELVEHKKIVMARRAENAKRQEFNKRLKIAKRAGIKR